MRYIQRSKLLLILCLSFAFFIEFPKEGYSTTYAIHADRAALNQEIYNYVDVLNEPIDSMYYYVNGSLVASSGPINNKRFLFSHVFSYVGNQSFYVQIVLPGGTTREYSW
ncbi:MAG: hypothetical protein HZA13_02090, partial [Nitrospirae bacterium]|nr:hypothetical protein [Nitrospirota bacterium]